MTADIATLNLIYDQKVWNELGARSQRIKSASENSSGKCYGIVPISHHHGSKRASFDYARWKIVAVAIDAV